MLNLKRGDISAVIEVHSETWEDELMGDDLDITASVFIKAVREVTERYLNLSIDESNFKVTEEVLGENEDGELRVRLYIGVPIHGFRSDDQRYEVDNKIIKKFFESDDYGVRVLNLQYDLANPEFIPELGTMPL